MCTSRLLSTSKLGSWMHEIITSKRKTRRRFRCMFCALFFGDGNLKQRFRCEFCALLLPSSSRGAAPSGSALLAPPRHGADSVGDSLAARASRAASVSIASSATPLSHVFLLGQKRMIGKRPSIGTRSGTRLTPLSPAHEPRRHRAFLSAPRSPVTGWHAGWQPWSRSSCLPIPLLTLIL